jgi:hypothetical protein
MTTRREILKSLGLSAAALPFLTMLPSLGLAAPAKSKRQRLVIIFSPNGTVPQNFWPDAPGPLSTFKSILQPLTPFKDKTLLLHGVSNKIRGDGDSHMRGMSCLLTAIELFPGNVQGGSHTPAGWASGISIDQELKNFLQKNPDTRTRLGSLELGVAVPDRADPWTRMSYAGPNQPVAPTDDPYQVLEKLYGRVKDKETLASILDDLQADFHQISKRVSSEDKRLLDEHLTLVREMERDLQRSDDQSLKHPVPKFDPGVANGNDNIPKLSRMQIELLVNALANDLTRVATLQYTNSVGNARHRWQGIEEGHHTLSHDPDLNTVSLEKLTKINTWYAEELAHLAKRLSETPEADGSGQSLFDNTTIVWTNELGKGNSHTLENIPFLLLGGGLGFKTGRSLKFEKVPHNRLWLSIAHAMGHTLKTFGNPKLSEAGPLDLTSESQPATRPTTRPGA